MCDYLLTMRTDKSTITTQWPWWWNECYSI